MTDREIMQQALDALEKIAAYRPLTFAECSDAEAVMGIAENAIPFLRERLAQPEQEPVACQYAKDVAMPEYRCAGKCQYAQPEQEPIKESSVTHSHLWIGELWRKEKNT